MSDLIAKLNSALKAKPSEGTTASFRHENEAAILDAAVKLLAKSETGRDLLNFARDKNISIHVLRNKQDFGYLPEQSVVYISCPANQQMPTTRAVIRLAGGLRDAMQDIEPELQRPNVKAGKERYVRAKLDKAADIALWQTAISYEINESTGLLEILDELFTLGYRTLYEGYKADQEAPL